MPLKLLSWSFTSILFHVHYLDKTTYRPFRINAHGPLTRFIKLWVGHALGMPGTFSPPPRVSDLDMHHGTCVMHVPWCMPGSLIIGFVWNRWRGKRCWHSHNSTYIVRAPLRRLWQVRNQFWNNIINIRKHWKATASCEILKYLLPYPGDEWFCLSSGGLTELFVTYPDYISPWAQSSRWLIQILLCHPDGILCHSSDILELNRPADLEWHHISSENIHYIVNKSPGR